MSLPSEMWWGPPVKAKSKTPHYLCGSRCRFKPSVVTPGLTAAAGNRQGSLGAKALWYFCTCPFPEECSKCCCRLLSVKRCCELLTSNSTDRQMFPRQVLRPFRCYCCWLAMLVFSATLAGEHLDLPKCGKLPLHLL